MSPIGLFAEIACLWEVTARKPGNVYPGREFADLRLIDFLLSAAAVGPVLDQACRQRVGQTVLEGVKATRQVTRGNSNLGILLLLAPLAAVPLSEDLAEGIVGVLARLDVGDSRAVYQAIRLAAPGGLGKVPDQDVAGEPTLPLRDIMALAAERDLVARQYANGFRQVFQEGVPVLERGLEQYGCVDEAIIGLHLHFMARHPDSLIARKRGLAEAEEAGRRAGQVLERGWPRTIEGKQALEDLDRWLRAKGNNRNPGTSADLVTACLFTALRRGIMTLPSPWPWSRE